MNQTNHTHKTFRPGVCLKLCLSADLRRLLGILQLWIERWHPRIRRFPVWSYLRQGTQSWGGTQILAFRTDELGTWDFFCENSRTKAARILWKMWKLKWVTEMVEKELGTPRNAIPNLGVFLCIFLPGSTTSEVSRTAPRCPNEKKKRLWRKPWNEVSFWSCC